MSGNRTDHTPWWKKMKPRTIFTIVSIINLTWYCVAVLRLTAHDHSVPDSLTVAWFAAWTAELGLLFGLKIKDKGV